MYHLKVDPEFIMPMKGQRAVFNSLQGQDCVDILRKLSQLLSNFYIGRTFKIAYCFQSVCKPIPWVTPSKYRIFGKEIW